MGSRQCHDDESWREAKDPGRVWMQVYSLWTMVWPRGKPASDSHGHRQWDARLVGMHPFPRPWLLLPLYSAHYLLLRSTRLFSTLLQPLDSLP